MIINSMPVRVHPETINLPHRSHEKRHYLTAQLEVLNEDHAEFATACYSVDPEFALTWSNLTINAIEETEEPLQNTRVTARFPSNAKIRGEIVLRHNRAAFSEFINIQALRETPIIIDWTQWVEASQNEEFGWKAALTKLINYHITHKLGHPFALHGAVFIPQFCDNTYQYIKSKTPWLMVFPSLEEIKDGWLELKNVRTVTEGEMDYQYLQVVVRLVSQQHLFCEDGEYVFTIQLRRPLHRYTTVKLEEGECHAGE